jgi:hypothetical protein
MRFFFYGCLYGYGVDSMNTSLIQPLDYYDTAYDLAEQKEAARQEAKDQIITSYRDGKTVSFSSKTKVSLDDAICDWLVIPNDDLDAFIQHEVGL